MISSIFHDKYILLYHPFDLKHLERCPDNVLVIAPHPDDDVIGAGGTMTLLAERGKNVLSLYVTDGRRFPDAASLGTVEKIISIRQREALAALKAVKAKGGIFLNFDSRALRNKSSGSAVKALREVLAFFLPASIYVPSPFEKHPTHRTVLALALAALRSIRGYVPELWGYQVWGVISGLREMQAVDISDVVKIKRRAIRMHRSQIIYKDYDEGILGRNRAEAVFLETRKPEKFQYAELFLDMRELVTNKRLSLSIFSKKILRSLYQPALLKTPIQEGR